MAISVDKGNFRDEATIVLNAAKKYWSNRSAKEIAARAYAHGLISGWNMRLYDRSDLFETEQERMRQEMTDDPRSALSPFTVIYIVEAEGTQWQFFNCMAEDADHAEDQCHDAELQAKVLWVNEGHNVTTMK